MDNGGPSYISCEKKSLLAGFAGRTVLGLPERDLHYILFLQLQLQVTIDSIASSSLDLRKATHAAAIVGLLKISFAERLQLVGQSILIWGVSLLGSHRICRMVMAKASLCGRKEHGVIREGWPGTSR